MTKAELLAVLRVGRAEWESLLIEVGEARMTQPGVAGEWSVKDIVAHVTWFEREMVGMLQAKALVGSHLWSLSQNERNAVIFEQNWNRPLADVLAEARAVFEQLVAALAGVTDDDLNDPARFPGMPAEWLPWKIIADNSYEHYSHHISSIRAWLDNKGERS